MGDPPPLLSLYIYQLLFVFSIGELVQDLDRLEVFISH